MPLMAYGDGTVTRRASGRYDFRKFIDGRRRTKTFDHEPTRREKLAAIREWSSTSASPVANSGDTLDQFLTKWLEDGTTHLRARTVRGYRTLVDLSIRPTLGDVPLVSLSTPLVQRWINEGATQHALAVLRTALSEAVRWGLLTSNPARGVRLPKREKAEPLILTPEQTRALLTQVKGDPLEALFVLAIYTGMRQGEILGLRWQDVDLKAGTLTVARSLWWMPTDEPRHPVPVLTMPKTQRSRRTIDLAPVVVEKLTEHRKRQMRDKPSKDGLVFATATGHALRPSAVFDSLRAHEKAAGLPVTTFHAIRHGAASFLIATGTPIPVVSKILGHSTVATTLNIYSHAIEDSQREAVDRMVALLGVASDTG